MIPNQHLIFLALLCTALPASSADAINLDLFTSDNNESNLAHSFVVVPRGMKIPEGITKTSIKGTLQHQSPFRIEILDPVSRQEKVQWVVTIPHNHFGRIRVRSDYSGNKRVNDTSTTWTSFKLDNKVIDRHILLFEPRRQKHLSRVYTKGKPTTSGGESWGGGTEDINVSGHNPRLQFLVEARVLNSDGSIKNRYHTSMQMDNKDMIRQEYINHFQIPRATAGASGKLPVPTRAEIGMIPPRPDGYQGNSLTESEYGLIIEDGAFELANQILVAYEDMKTFLRTPGNGLKDLSGNPLKIPDSRLWLSSGWRNPERNEWYSDALNGAHQLGIALDIMPNEIPREKQAAIVYWVLWKAVQSLPDQHRRFAQLESLSIPVRASSYKIDIEPKNGIPDAFDIADHLHINLLYE